MKEMVKKAQHGPELAYILSANIALAMPGGEG